MNMAQCEVLPVQMMLRAKRLAMAPASQHNARCPQRAAAAPRYSHQRHTERSMTRYRYVVIMLCYAVADARAMSPSYVTLCYRALYSHRKQRHAHIDVYTKAARLRVICAEAEAEARVAARVSAYRSNSACGAQSAAQR